jgi:alpha-beta hydrolase superfamily lysophospholipase
MTSESVVRVCTLDGLHLVGTLVEPDVSTRQGVVFVHGGGVTRDEAGFFTRLAAGLASAGVASLRYDLRGHGESEGRQEDAPLSAHLNDMRVVLAELRSRAGVSEASLLAASFSGGMAACYAARGSDPLARLVLINPLLDYKDRFINQKPYWHDDHIDDEHAGQLTEAGYIEHSPTFKLGRALLNEVFWMHPRDVLGEIIAPTLILHGTKDTFISMDSSRAAVALLRAPHRLVEIEGAQHGIAVHDDPQYLNPQSQEWQAFAIQTIADWITVDVARDAEGSIVA